MARNFKQGLFVPTHPEKYVGNVNKIWYRSSYELQTFEFLDRNPNVKRWASEEIHIDYFDIVSQKMRKYYPDIWVEYVTADGEVKQEIIEIKPRSQVRKPNSRHKHYASEALTFETNKCKWAAAEDWCKYHSRNSNEITFRILTEKSIFK